MVNISVKKNWRLLNLNLLYIKLDENKTLAILSHQDTPGP